MKTIFLDIIKKNRLYFKCLTENGFDAKLKITAKSENLGLGKKELLVKDISIRTKYGTEIIFELEGEVENVGIITFSHPSYNLDLINRCRQLGGRWDSENKVWCFTKLVEKEVEELDEKYNSNLEDIEITAKSDLSEHQFSVCFSGYPPIKFWGPN